MPSVYSQRILLVRPGNSYPDGNQHWYTGPSTFKPLSNDTGLSKKGTRQIDDLCRHLKKSGISKIEAIYASPFSKAVESASLISRKSNGPDVHVENGLADCNHINFAASFNPARMFMPLPVLKKLFGTEVNTKYHSIASPAYPEDFKLLYDRCRKVLKYILNTHKKKGVIVVVSHPLVIEAISNVLRPSTLFTEGITEGSLTDLEISRSSADSDVVSVSINCLAADSFIQDSEPRKGYKFLTQKSIIFSPSFKFGAGCCTPEVDVYHETLTINRKSNIQREKYDEVKATKGSAQANSSIPNPLPQKVVKTEVAAPKVKVKSPAQLEFEKYSNGQEFINVQEAAQLCRKHGFSPSLKDLDILKKKHEKLTFDQFQKWEQKCPKHDDPASLLPLFEHLDGNNTGVLARDTISRIFSIYGERVDESTTEDILCQLGYKNKMVPYEDLLHSLLRVK